MTAPLPFAVNSIWPEGLAELDSLLWLSDEEWLHEAFVKTLEEQAIVHSGGKERVSAPLVGVGLSAGFRGALRVNRDEEKWVVAWDLRPSPDPWPDLPPDRRVLDPLSLGAFLKPFLTKSEKEPTVIGGTFRLSTSAWKPTVKLPVRLPGFLDTAQGAPEITGFEFRFTSSDNPLRRAEISVLLPQRLRVELMVLLRFSPEENLLYRICDALGTHLPLLATRTATGEEHLNG